MEEEKKDDPDQTLTIEEVKNLLHVSKRTVYTYYTQGKLKAVRLPGHAIRFTRRAIREFIKRHEAS